MSLGPGLVCLLLQMQFFLISPFLMGGGGAGRAPCPTPRRLSSTHAAPSRTCFKKHVWHQAVAAFRHAPLVLGSELSHSILSKSVFDSLSSYFSFLSRDVKQSSQRQLCFLLVHELLGCSKTNLRQGKRVQLEFVSPQH